MNVYNFSLVMRVCDGYIKRNIEMMSLSEERSLTRKVHKSYHAGSFHFWNPHQKCLLASRLLAGLVQRFSRRAFPGEAFKRRRNLGPKSYF